MKSNKHLEKRKKLPSNFSFDVFARILEKTRENLFKKLGRYATILRVGSKTEMKPRHVEIGTSKDENASEFQIFEQNTTIEETLKVRLERIEHALQKLKQGAKGNYGKCELCKKPIELKRLKSFPEARYCIACHRKNGEI